MEVVRFVLQEAKVHSSEWSANFQNFRQNSKTAKTAKPGREK